MAEDKIPYRITIELAVDTEFSAGKTIQVTGLVDRIGDPLHEDRDLTRIASKALGEQSALMDAAVKQTEVADTFDSMAGLLNMPASRTVN